MVVILALCSFPYTTQQDGMEGRTERTEIILVSGAFLKNNLNAVYNREELTIGFLPEILRK